MNAGLKIGVLGPHRCVEEERTLGFSVGQHIARQGAVLVCGGLGGMMAAAAEGARSQNGLTIGLLPGDRASEANPFIDIALPTGLGVFRNILVVRACDAVIAVRGGYGTLTEIAYALRLGIPVIGLQTWCLVRDGKPDSGIGLASTPEEAVDMALRQVGRKRTTTARDKCDPD